MFLIRSLLIFVLFVSVSIYAQDEDAAPAEQPEKPKTEAQKILDKIKADKEAKEAEKAKLVSVGALSEQLAKVEKAAKGKKFDEIEKLVFSWKMPKAEQIFVDAYKQKLGRELGKGYALFVEKNIAELSSSPLLAMLARYSDEGYQIQLKKLSKDRAPRRGLELSLSDMFKKNGAIVAVNLAKGTERLTSASTIYYFVVVDGAWRCAGTAGYYNFGADTGIDPIKKQEPKEESLSKVFGTLRRACIRDDKEEVERIVSGFRIPKSDIFFKDLFKGEGLKVDTSYETCMTKYVESPNSEIKTALQIMSAQITVVDKPDSGEIGAWVVKIAKAYTKEKSPLFVVKIYDANAAETAAPLGFYYFLYIDRAFRLIGPRGFQDEGVLKPKEAPASVPVVKTKKKK